MTAAEVTNIVREHFEGLAPMKLGDVDLGAIVLAVLAVLKDHGFLDIEVEA